MRLASAASSRTGEPSPASTLMVVSRSVAVTEPLAAAATTALVVSAAFKPEVSSAKFRAASKSIGSPLPMPPVVNDKPVTL